MGELNKAGRLRMGEMTQVGRLRSAMLQCRRLRSPHKRVPSVMPSSADGSSAGHARAWAGAARKQPPH